MRGSERLSAVFSGSNRPNFDQRGYKEIKLGALSGMGAAEILSGQTALVTWPAEVALGG